jgi:glycosyltransferase involved in cell wall biosynthesis
MKISVIIPVYNAEKYVRKAVESALQQAETGEILLVEDNSPDNCLQICQDLEKEHEKVRLLRHPDGKNHGAGATRNLGIKNAKFDYIAFLDADDFYLPDRFVVAKKLFQQRHDIDGVYEATGVKFHSAKGKQKWRSSGRKDLMTMTENLPPDHLFEALVRGKKGTFHLDALTVKKMLFEKSGYFFEHLRLHQDTAMIVQMSVYGRLLPGRLTTPVAMRGIHGQNRITSGFNKFHNRFLYCDTLFHWAVQKKLGKTRLLALCRGYIYAYYRLLRERDFRLPEFVPEPRVFIRECMTQPLLFVTAAIQLVFQRLRGQ